VFVLAMIFRTKSFAEDHELDQIRVVTIFISN